MLRINQEEIDPALIEDAFHRIKSEHELQSESSCCERDEEFFAKAEEEVIYGILLAQEAEKRYPTVPKELFQTQYEQTIKDWRKYGASWELIEAQSLALREETAAKLRMKLFAEEVCKDVITPNDQMCQEYYDQNLPLYFHPPSVRAWHLMRTPDRERPWVEHQQMTKWRQMIIDGADFIEFAREHTAKSDRAIDLGWIDMERATNAFESILFSLRIGEVSPVISYESAFHLVWVSESKPGHHFSFAEKIEEIRHVLMEKMRRDAMRQLAEQLKSHACIEKS